MHLIIVLMVNTTIDNPHSNPTWCLLSHIFRFQNELTMWWNMFLVVALPLPLEWDYLK